MLLYREDSGRVLDSRPRGRGFEPHRCHCVVSLSETYLSKLYNSTGSTQEGERSGSVVECLTRDREAAGSSLTGCHCVVSLSNTHLSKLSTGSTQEDPSLHN